MNIQENKITLTVEEYYAYELELSERYEAKLRNQDMPATPMIDKIDAAGLNGSSQLLRMTWDIPNNQVVLENSEGELL